MYVRYIMSSFFGAVSGLRATSKVVPSSLLMQGEKFALFRLGSWLWVMMIVQLQFLAIFCNFLATCVYLVIVGEFSMCNLFVLCLRLPLASNLHGEKGKKERGVGLSACFHTCQVFLSGNAQQLTSSCNCAFFVNYSNYQECIYILLC